MVIVKEQRYRGWIPAGIVLNAIDVSEHKVISTDPNFNSIAALYDRNTQAIRLRGSIHSIVFAVKAGEINTAGAQMDAIHGPISVNPFVEECVLASAMLFEGTIQVMTGPDIPLVSYDWNDLACMYQFGRAVTEPVVPSVYVPEGVGTLAPFGLPDYNVDDHQTASYWRRYLAPTQIITRLSQLPEDDPYEEAILSMERVLQWSPKLMNGLTAVRTIPDDESTRQYFLRIVLRYSITVDAHEVNEMYVNLVTPYCAACSHLAANKRVLTDIDFVFIKNDSDMLPYRYFSLPEGLAAGGKQSSVDIVAQAL